MLICILISKIEEKQVKQEKEPSKDTAPAKREELKDPVLEDDEDDEDADKDVSSFKILLLTTFLKRNLTKHVLDL